MKKQKSFKKRLTSKFCCDIIIYVVTAAATKPNIGVSPSGKASDSDSAISRVQILPPQPVKNRIKCGSFCNMQ